MKEDTKASEISASYSICRACSHQVYLPKNPSGGLDWTVEEEVIYLMDKQKEHKCNG